MLWLFLTATRPALAVPVYPEAVELAQPDGTTFTAQPFGDEWYNGYEHEGYTILKSKADGYWYYAVQIGPGMLVTGAQRAGQGQPQGIAPHLRDSLKVVSASVIDNLPGGQMGPGSTPDAGAPGIWPGASGAQAVLVILVDFTPSTSLGTTASQWNAAFFDNTPGAKSVKNFYEEASFNQFTLTPAAETQGTHNDGIIAVTLGYAHPNTGGTTGDANRLITKNALIAADPYINYAAYDTNSSGGLDSTELHIMIIPRGFETAYGGTANACSPSVWGHRWSLHTTVSAPTLDSVKVANYFDGGGYMQFGEWQEQTGSGCTGSTGQMATIGIMAHELGHDIDWPDLYDTDYSSAGVGYWSIMSGGSWGALSGQAAGSTPVLPDAYSKWYQGWITPTLVTGPMSSVAIPNAAQNAVAYQLVDDPTGIDWDFNNSSGTGEFFLVENRQQVGFDAGLGRQGSSVQGCIIWHIDETRPYSNSNNDTESRKHVDVEEAHGTQYLDTTGPLYYYAGHPWPGSSNNTTFDYNSTPNSRFYNGSDSGVVISGISTAGSGCTVNFYATSPNLVLSTPDIDVGQAPNQQVAHTLTIGNSGGSDLTWSIWEDASSSPAEMVAAPIAMGEAALSAGEGPPASPLEQEVVEAIEGPAPPPGTTVSLVLDDDSVETNIGTGGGTMMWLNRFTPAGGDFPFELTRVDVRIGSLPAGSPVDIWVYEDNDTNPANGATTVGGWSSTVGGANGWNSYTLSSPPTLSGGGDVLIGIVASHVNGQFPASEDTTTSAGRSWLGGAPGAGGSLNLAGTIDSFGYTGNWMLRGYGAATDLACDSPDDISWLSLNPTGGTTGAGNQSDVAVTLDSTGMSNGSYNASLCLDSNDPITPETVIPITLEICTAPAALSNVAISYLGNDNSISWSGVSGEYEVWWGLNAPYFMPGADCSGAANCTLASSSPYAHSSANDNYSYMVLPRDACGSGSARAALSNRVGRFNFALTPGQ